MIRTYTTLLISWITLCTGLVMVGQTESEWKKVINKNDVEVFVHHCHHMNVRAFRAIATVNMSLDSLEKIFDDVENYPKWQENVREAKIVHRFSDDKYHFYSRNQQGWPARQRDLIWAVEKSWDTRTASLVYDQIASTNMLPENHQGGVATQAFVSWRLEPLSEHEVKVTYNLTIQNGRRTPNWILAMLNANNPYKTLFTLRDHYIKGDGSNDVALD